MDPQLDDTPHSAVGEVTQKNKRTAVYEQIPSKLDEDRGGSTEEVGVDIPAEKTMTEDADDLRLIDDNLPWYRKFSWYSKIRERINQIKNHPIYKRFSFLMIVFSMILANILFMLVNKDCPLENDRICVTDYIRPRTVRFTLQVGVAAFIFTYILLSSLYYRRISLIYGIASLCNVIYLVFFYNPILTWKNYGQVFAMGLAVEFVLMLSLFAILQAAKYTYRRSKIIFVLALIVIFGVLPTVFYYTRVKGSCDNWVYGLGRDQINNTVGCQVDIPTECVFDWFEMMDLSVLMKSCAHTPSDTRLMKRYYVNATTTDLIGLPRIEFAPYEMRKRLPLMSQWVLENAVSLTGFDDPKAKDLEIFIDNSVHGKAKLEIKVKRNETLVNERKKLDTGKQLAKNVIVIFLDTLSRARMYQKMKKTVAWLERFYNQSSNERETFQFFKFHSVGAFTKNNMWAAYGDALLPTYPPSFAPPKVPREMFGKTYIENGYITGRVGGFCGPSSLGIMKSHRAYLHEVAFDHEGSSMSCDPQYTAPESSYGLFTGPYSMLRRCLYGKDMYEHIFEYGSQFWRTYKEEKKLLMLEFLEGHEGTQEVIKYNDAGIVNFLEGLDKDKLLDDTFIVLFSDHGNHIGLFPHNLFNRTWWIERTLPLLFLSLPKNLADEYRADLKVNSQKFVSMYQLYEIFMAIPLGRDSPHTWMSPLKALPDLTCEDALIAAIPCTCNYNTSDTGTT